MMESQILTKRNVRDGNGSFFCAEFHLQTVLLENERLSDAQEIKTPRLDESRCSQIEGARKKENTGVNYRSDFKADRRFNAAESFQYGSVDGFAGLEVFRKVAVVSPRLRYQLKAATPCPLCGSLRPKLGHRATSDKGP